MLRGRRILVTGASSGIGRSLARAYAEQGAAVFAVARGEAPLREVAASCSGRIEPVPADLAAEPGRRAVATAIEHAGGRLDVVVHAAGALGPVGDEAALVRYPADAWYRVFEVNMSAVHFLHQRLAAYLERGHRPVVIGISSTVGRVGRAGWGMYAISKRALEGWLGAAGCRMGRSGTGLLGQPGGDPHPHAGGRRARRGFCHPPLPRRHRAPVSPSCPPRCPGTVRRSPRCSRLDRPRSLGRPPPGRPRLSDAPAQEAR